MKYLILIFIFSIFNCKKNIPCSVLDSSCNPLGYFLPSLITPKLKTIAPTNIITFTGASSLSILSATSITLTWTAATSPASSSSAIVYNIYSSITSGTQNFSTPIQTTAAGITSITLTVTANTDTYFVVRAKDTSNNEDTNKEERAALLNGLIRFVPLDSTALTTGEKIGNQPVLPIGTPLLNTIDRKGIANNAYSLNGTSQWFSLSETLPLAMPIGNTARTFCLWVKFNSLPAMAAPVMFSQGNNTGSGLLLFQVLNNVTPGLFTGPMISYGPELLNPTTTWNFVCMSYKINGAINFQMNSNSSNTTGTVLATASNASTPNGPIIGAYNNGLSNWLNGSITEVSVWNRTLTSAELLQVYKN